MANICVPTKLSSVVRCFPFHRQQGNKFSANEHLFPQLPYSHILPQKPTHPFPRTNISNNQYSQKQRSSVGIQQCCCPHPQGTLPVREGGAFSLTFTSRAVFLRSPCVKSPNNRKNTNSNII